MMEATRSHTMQISCSHEHCWMSQEVEIPSTRLDYFFTPCKFCQLPIKVQLPRNNSDRQWEFFKLGCAEVVFYTLFITFILGVVAALTAIAAEKLLS